MAFYDVLVIGGGPAGMMAAGMAGEKGARVALLEKNQKPGRKLLLTGGGRCNLTQAVFEPAELVQKYGRKGKFLFPAFNLFGPREVMDFFECRGLRLKTEPAGRVFPESDRAEDVLEVLLSFLQGSRVQVMTSSPVAVIKHRGGKITSVIAGGSELSAGRFVLCTGGKSYPGTGSTGDGYGWARELGHTVSEISPALVPLRVAEKWIAELKGLSVSDVRVALVQDGKERVVERGEVMFTHFGLSGPAVLNLSRSIPEINGKGKVIISIDLFPQVEPGDLGARLLANFSAAPNRLLKNSLAPLVVSRMAEFLVKRAGLKGEKQVNEVNREERRRLAELMKGLEFSLAGTLGFGKAMVTIGGVSLKEIDPNAMQSKVADNLFFAGEILDLDGPSGGYNLQLCWATGYLAGTAAAEK